LQARSTRRRTDSGEEWHTRFPGAYLLLATILVVQIVFSILVFDPRLDTGGDNAHYICLARSMLSGEGYRDIFEPGNPPHTQYPFGYPLLLALIMVPFRDSLIALKLLSAALSVGSVVLFFLLMRGKCGSILLYTTTLLFSVTPLLLQYGHKILSDVPFTFFSLLSLFLFKKGEQDRRWFSPFLWASVVAMVFTYHIRTVGAALFVALLVYLGSRKQFARMFLVLGVMALLVLPWTLRTARLSEGGGYVTQLLLRNPYDRESGTVGPGDLLRRVGANGEAYFASAIPRSIVAIHERVWPMPSRRWDIYLFGFAVSGLILLGFVDDMRRRHGILHFYILLYMGILLIWPQVWASDRFFLPVAPFGVFYLFKGGLFIFSRIDPAKRRRFGLTVAGLLLLSSTVTLSRGMGGNLMVMRLYASGDRTAGYSADWVNYFRAASFASRSTPSDAVFMARKPALFYLFAERKCVVYPFTYIREEILGTIAEKGVEYIVLDSFFWTKTTERYLYPALLEHKEDFSVVYTTPPPVTYVLRYKPEERPNEE
jgi:4-amino-4-deoxy-L-arabinose transferase-like glycosyltransferase